MLGALLGLGASLLGGGLSGLFGRKKRKKAERAAREAEEARLQLAREHIGRQREAGLESIDEQAGIGSQMEFIRGTGESSMADYRRQRRAKARERFIADSDAQIKQAELGMDVFKANLSLANYQETMSSINSIIGAGISTFGAMDFGGGYSGSPSGALTSAGHKGYSWGTGLF